MTSVDDFLFDDITATDGFFNENEVDIMNSVVNGGTGVYKLTMVQSLFVSAEKVEEIAEENVEIENGRITILGETDGDCTLYVKFVV